MFFCFSFLFFLIIFWNSEGMCSWRDRAIILTDTGDERQKQTVLLTIIVHIFVNTITEGILTVLTQSPLFENGISLERESALSAWQHNMLQWTGVSLSNRKTERENRKMSVDLIFKGTGKLQIVNKKLICHYNNMCLALIGCLFLFALKG